MSMAESVAQGDPFKRDHFAFGAGKSVVTLTSNPGLELVDIFE